MFLVLRQPVIKHGVTIYEALAVFEVFGLELVEGSLVQVPIHDHQVRLLIGNDRGIPDTVGVDQGKFSKTPPCVCYKKRTSRQKIRNWFDAELFCTILN